MNFSGKTILITGASSGLGYHLTRLLMKENCTIFILARRIELLNQLALLNNNPGCKIIPLQCDVSQKEEVKTSLNTIMEQAGKIDIAILNSGINHKADLESFDLSLGEEIMQINFFGVVYFIKYLFPIMKKQGEGVIAGVSSLADSRGYANAGFYSASKAALTKYLESLRVELKQFNIKVITIKPGFVKTPMTDLNEFPMPFLMDPEKAAHIMYNGLLKGKNVIRFPFPTSLGSRLLAIMPNKLFDFLMKFHLKKQNR
jgi:short-subunit dehydrogenase